MLVLPLPILSPKLLTTFTSTNINDSRVNVIQLVLNKGDVNNATTAFKMHVWPLITYVWFFSSLMLASL